MREPGSWPRAGSPARPASRRGDGPGGRLEQGRRYPAGGWSGREGGSDLYYTAFALRGLAVLGALAPEVAGRAAEYLRQRSETQAGVIDFFSFLYAAALVQLGGGGDVLATSPPDWPD